MQNEAISVCFVRETFLISEKGSIILQITWRQTSDLAKIQ